MPNIYPVILSGGVGSRLWPLSRDQFPKQLQALNSELTLLQETALRVSSNTHINFETPLIICNEAHRFIVGEQLSAIGVDPRAIIIEPTGRDTAPAAAVSALLLDKEEDALILIMASDHLISKTEAFRLSIASSVPVASSGRLVSLGVEPTFASPSYGYIKRGASISGLGDACGIEGFVEKPEAAKASEFLKSGEYLWNSGIFLFPAELYLSELNKFEPDIVPGCQAALDKGRDDLFFFRLEEEAFLKVPSQSIDRGVMERTTIGAVVPVDIGWADVGSWSALHEKTEKDIHGNSLIGDVKAIDNHGTYVRSESQFTAAIGLKDTIVVVTDDAVLVADKAHDQTVKNLVEDLKAADRKEATSLARVYRPWGWFQTIDEGEQFRVKRIVIKPGAKLSLQKHKHRSEHWVVVRGEALVTRREEEFLLRENESAFIPAGTLHRLANPSDVELHMVEVQSGKHILESDIVRIEDEYGRAEDV